jgi:hypothetical protein
VQGKGTKGVIATKIARINKKKPSQEREQMAEEASARPLAAGRGWERGTEIQSGGWLQVWTYRSLFPSISPTTVKLGEKNMQNQGTNWQDKSGDIRAQLPAGIRRPTAGGTKLWGFEASFQFLFFGWSAAMGQGLC